MESAIDYCIEHGILEDILSEHRAEVIAVFLTEYDAQAHMEMEREEWTEKGREIQLVNLVRKKMTKGMSEEDIAEILEMDAGRVAQICRQIRENPEWDDLKVCEGLLK